MLFRASVTHRVVTPGFVLSLSNNVSIEAVKDGQCNTNTNTNTNTKYYVCFFPFCFVV